MRRVLLPAVGLLLLMAACGDDATTDSTVTTVTTVTGDVTTTSVATTTTADVTTTTSGADTTTTPAGIAVAVADYCVTGTASDDTLNLRAGPGTDFADIGDLAFDATGVRTTGVGDHDGDGRLWYEIESGADRVWVASWFLAPDGSDRCGVIEGDTLEVALARDGLIVDGTRYYRWSLQAGGGQEGYADGIVAAVSNRLGAPVFDSGWGEPGEEGQARSVRWGSLFTLFFTNDVGKPADYPEGLLCGPERDGECFDGFKYFGDPDGIGSEIAGVTVGDTIAQVIAGAQTFEPFVFLTAPDSSYGITLEDLYVWVQIETGGPWGLSVGSPEFGGTLCFLTDETGAEPPDDDAVVVMVGTWCSP